MKRITALVLAGIMLFSFDAGAAGAFAAEGAPDDTQVTEPADVYAADPAGEYAGDPAGTPDETVPDTVSPEMREDPVIRAETETPAEGTEPMNPTTPPGPPNLKKVRGLSAQILNKSQILLTWTEDESYGGYQIQYAKNVLYVYSKKKNLKGWKKNNITLSGLTTDYHYFIRIRGYKYYKGKKYWSEWRQIRTKGKLVRASASYIKKHGKKMDVRKQAWKKLKAYDVMQGCCSDGRYVYMAFEKRNGDDNGRKARIKIAKVRISDWKLVRVSPKGMMLGHANDITYNKHRKILVVTGCKVNDPYVRLVNPKTLKKTYRKKVKLGKKFNYVKAFNAIDYDPETRTYYIRSREYDAMTFTLDQNFRIVSDSVLPSVYPTRHIQGSMSFGDMFVIPQSYGQSKTRNTLTIYKKAGKKLQHMRVKLKGEIESVFMIGRRVYASVHKWIHGYKSGYIVRLRF